MRVTYCDSEELSEALRHTNVSAMQIDKGSFEAHLSHLGFAGWSLQSIEFRQGSSVCAGDAPRDRHAVVVPLKYSPRSRLLGKPLTDGTFSVYAPGSEHADVTYAGQQIAVLVPPPEFAGQADGDGIVVPANGSHLWAVSPAGHERLKELLSRLQASQAEPNALASSEVQRSIADSVSRALTSALAPLEPSEGEAALGRPRLPRTAILRRISEILEERKDETIFAAELAREVGISQPSLQRVFLEWFGMPPARYLTMKRFYLARRRLRDAKANTVTDVAVSLGFWDLSRFAKSYKDLFGELPSETLRRSRKP